MILWYTPYPPVIDQGTLSDVDDLAEIHAASFHRGWSAAELEALLVQDKVLTVVARRGSPFGSRRPVGFVMVRAAGDEAEILTLAVAPRHRSRGLGRDLMEAALRRLYHDRVASVFLEVDEANDPALRLYRRLGFREVGRRRNYYAVPGGPPSTALVLKAEFS